ncbi:hypothetical protein ES708_31138 [subsurface metagenome]
MAGKMLGIGAALAERNDGAEGHTFPKAQQDLVAQILGVLHVLHQQHSFDSQFFFAESPPHLPDRVLYEIEVFVDDLYPTGFLFMSDLAGHDLEHDSIGGEYRERAVGDVLLVPGDDVGRCLDLKLCQDFIHLMLEQLLPSFGGGVFQDPLDSTHPGLIFRRSEFIHPFLLLLRSSPIPSPRVATAPSLYSRSASQSSWGKYSSFFRGDFVYIFVNLMYLPAFLW